MSVNCDCARSIALMAVETCSKAILAHSLRHGKSPCFSRCSVFALVDVDSAGSDFTAVDVEEILE